MRLPTEPHHRKERGMTRRPWQTTFPVLALFALSVVLTGCPKKPAPQAGTGPGGGAGPPLGRGGGSGGGGPGGGGAGRGRGGRRRQHEPVAAVAEGVRGERRAPGRLLRLRPVRRAGRGQGDA